jgi:hypothetical protein
VGKSFTSQQMLLGQGIAWLKANLNKLTEDFVTGIEDLPDVPYQRLPGFLRRMVAKDMLQDLINRLEDNTYDTQAATKKLSNALKKGATLASVVSVVELLNTVVSTRARQDLANQPEVLEVLLNKTNYFTTLLKSSLASAAINN